ncbi:MAG: MOSC domain-containing protein [Dehalococcoidales bacterium]|jgi:MOSC domain-containing protein YiiM|nr:MOSC domain-containing protein [Dehalococcoidales bacterium]
MAKIIAVCVSEKKGEKKKTIKEGVLKEEYGLIGDAHANSSWHRQVSMLSQSSVDKMQALGVDVGPGDFAENLTIEGMDLFSLPIGTRFSVGHDIILEMTQIGKECHDHCAIYQQVGTCIMPTEGIFTRVIKGGRVKSGDELKII